MKHAIPTLAALARHPITKPLMQGAYGSVGVGIWHVVVTVAMALLHRSEWRFYAVALVVPVGGALFLWLTAHRVFTILHPKMRPCPRCERRCERGAPEDSSIAPVATIRGYRQ